jgi:hypothetical protein
MSYNQKRIDEILDATYRRACRRANKFKPNTNLSKLPAGVVVSNNLSRTAYFQDCRQRRQGYLFSTTPEAFVELNHKPLAPKQRELLEDRWLRGVMWQPMLIKVKPTTYQGEAAWEVWENPDWAIATFLAEKGWKRLVVQALEMQDVPATNEGLNAFRQGGLICNHGVGLEQQIPIFSPRITF